MEAHHHEAERSKGSNLSTAFIIGTLLNLLFVIVESGFGFASNSVGLLSDAGHNLSDTISLLLAFLAFRLSKVAPNKKYTYGLSKSTILVSLINACILLIAIGMIVMESIRKFKNPQPIDENTMIWVAAVGILINFGTAMLFNKDRKRDLNVKGAFIHMAMDALVSVGVVVSGIIIKYTGWYVIDPILGLVIAVIIFITTWDLLRQSIRLSLDGVPEDIDIDKIRKLVEDTDGVMGIHHLHIWAIGTSENALTTHITISDNADEGKIKKEIKQKLKANGIDHATIETEPKGYICDDDHCECNGIDKE